MLCENATVAERIRFYRTKRNLTGNTLAMQIGLSRYAIMNYENATTEPTLVDLKKIASALDVNPCMLYDGYYQFLDYPYSMRIKQLRVEHQLHQRELGAVLGVNRRAVERWELGKAVISRATWEMLVSLKYL